MRWITFAEFVAKQPKPPVQKKNPPVIGTIEPPLKKWNKVLQLARDTGQSMQKMNPAQARPYR